MRKIGLINVAGPNVVLAASDASRIGVTRLTGNKTGVPGPSQSGSWRLCARETSLQLSQAVTALAKQFFPRFSTKSRERWAVHQVELVRVVIHCGHEIEEGHVQVGEAQIIGGQGGKGFERSDKIIAEISDGPTKKRRQPIRPRDRRIGEGLPERIEHGARGGRGVPVGLNVMVLRSAGQCQVWMAADERITRGRLGAIPALQEKRRAVGESQALIKLEDVRLR